MRYTIKVNLEAYKYAEKSFHYEEAAILATQMSHYCVRFVLAVYARMRHITAKFCAH